MNRLLILIALVLTSLSSGASSNPIMLRLPGIPGPYCAYGVEKRLLELEEVQQVTISWDNEALMVFMKDGAELSPERIDEVMKKADYPYRYSIER
ncbi:MAG: hypothetical protein ACREJP_02050 [Candidatus Methylomirabilales bacterium]